MSVNRHRPHIFILPEDDANRQLANGFLLKLDNPQIRILVEARGWSHVREDFVSDHIVEMRKYDKRFMVLLIDFDDALPGRLRSMLDAIPGDLTDRVFVVGVRTDPEALKRALGGSYEDIGRTMADDCRTDHTIWTHDLLSHNENELSRLRKAVGDWLFSP